MHQISTTTTVPAEEPGREALSAGSRVAAWLLSFRRVTSSTRYIPEVDGLRFIAIACVFIFHTAGDVLRHSPTTYRDYWSADPFFRLTQHLNFGVQLFFVISGFVLALPFATQRLAGGRPVSLRAYLLRRLTRLEPPYVIALCLFFALKVAGARGSAGELLPRLLASICYLHNLIYKEPSSINFVSWSLEIEVQFYLLAPFLARALFSSRNTLVRRCGIVIAIVASSALPLALPGRSIGLILIGQLAYFLAGMLLADIYVTGGCPTAARSGWGDLLAFGSAAVLVFLLSQNVPVSLPGPVLACVAYYGVFRSFYARRILSFPFLAIVGGMCYSIYLIHNYIIAVAGYATERLSPGGNFEIRLAVQSILLGFLVLLASAIYFKLIEQPCMNPAWPAELRRRLARIPANQELVRS